MARCLPSEYRGFLEHIESCTYSDRPDYGLLRSLIHQASLRRNIHDTDPFDWETNSTESSVPLESSKQAAAAAPAASRVPGVHRPSYVETIGVVEATTANDPPVLPPTTAAGTAWSRGPRLAARGSENFVDSPDEARGTKNAKVGGDANLTVTRFSKPPGESGRRKPPLRNKSREHNNHNNGGNQQHNNKKAEEIVPRATSLPLPTPPTSSRYHRSTSILQNHQGRRNLLIGCSTSDLADRSAGGDDVSLESGAAATHALAISIANQGRGGRLCHFNSGSMTQMAGLGLSSQDLPSFVGDDVCGSENPLLASEVFSGKAVSKLSRRMSSASLSEKQQQQQQRQNGGVHTPKSGSPSQQNAPIHHPHREHNNNHHHQVGGWRGVERFPRPMPRCSAGRVSCSPPRHFNSMRRRRGDSPAHWNCNNNGSSVGISPTSAMQQSVYTLRRLAGSAVRRSASHTKLDNVCARPDSPFCSWCSSGQQQAPPQLQLQQQGSDIDSPPPPPVTNFAVTSRHPGNRSRSSSRSSARQQNLLSQRVFFQTGDGKLTTNLEETNLDEKALADGLMMLRMGSNGCCSGNNGTSGGNGLSPRPPPPPELPVSPTGRNGAVMAARRRKYRPRGTSMFTGGQNGVSANVMPNTTSSSSAGAATSSLLFVQPASIPSQAPITVATAVQTIQPPSPKVE